ncbi:hypothetical protein PTI98_000479 [Pleurotus ostreatus]|nr:hypothetical protein PTI98_000479 [Pleurotus ostreatus]
MASRTLASPHFRRSSNLPIDYSNQPILQSTNHAIMRPSNRPILRASEPPSTAPYESKRHTNQSTKSEFEFAFKQEFEFELELELEICPGWKARYVTAFPSHPVPPSSNSRFLQSPYS